MPIISTSDYKAYAGIVGAALDARLGVLIPGVQGEFEVLCGRRFDAATYTDAVDASETPVVIVKNPPISGTVTIAMPAADGTPTTLYTGAVVNGQLQGAGNDGVKIDVDSGVIEFSDSYISTASSREWPLQARQVLAPSWRSGPLAYTVTYTGGYAVAPDALKLAMYELVGSRLAVMLRRGDSSMQSETLGNYTYTLRDGGDHTSLMESHARRWRRRWS